ncbi:MAG: hypothetical protein CMJ76_10760 [Planctomycetaceae bacterium]|nr:hypothetical protein [Planctomycetaceae bacterium]
MELNRRTILQATGVSLALPLMEAMNPLYACSEEAPQRSVFICTALGLHPPSFWPETAGRDYESTFYLDLLQEHRDEYTLFSGLSHSNQVGRQAHDSEMTWLTSTPKPGNAGFRNGISVDQVVANHFGYTTRFPSINLGSDRTQSQAYTSGGVMLPAKYDPREIFSELFLDGRPEEIRRQKRRLAEGRSILDELKGQTGRLRRRISGDDNHLLDDYFDSVRATELNISELEGWIDRPKPKVSQGIPLEIDPRQILNRLDSLMGLVPLMLQTDSTRTVTFLIQDPHVDIQIDGVDERHHILSHHGQDLDKIRQLRIIESGIVSAFAGLLAKLKTTDENGQRLIDNTSLIFGSNLGNANSHDARNLPVIMAGGGFTHGQYVAYDKEDNTELSNLYLTILQRQGLEVEAFGQSTGTLEW